MTDRAVGRDPERPAGRAPRGRATRFGAPLLVALAATSAAGGCSRHEAARATAAALTPPSAASAGARQPAGTSSDIAAAGSSAADRGRSEAPPTGPSASSGAERPTGVAPRAHDPRAWESPERCAEVLAGGVPRAPTGRARIATWNVRWFPDGKPGRGTEPGTPRRWLGCALASLAADAVAVQEFKTSDHADAALAEVLGEVERLTGERWAAVFDDCPDGNGQHVGVLWNTARVHVEAVAVEPALNPRGSACKDHVRPGMSAHLRFPGGLDLHLVSVHFKSSPEARSFDDRRRSVAALTVARDSAAQRIADDDVVFAGDFNTMGCAECEPPIDSAGELALFDRELAAQPTAQRRVSGAACSEYYRGHGGLLDHFVLPSAMAEAVDASVEGHGPCGGAECPLHGGALGRALRELSDHCPLVLELTDRDLD